MADLDQEAVPPRHLQGPQEVVRDTEVQVLYKGELGHGSYEGRDAVGGAPSRS